MADDAVPFAPQGQWRLSYKSIVQRNYGVISQKQQRMLRKSKVAIVGMGCTGGMAATIMARMGVGLLTLIDDDVVEPSNLNRQPLSSVSTLGQKKVVAARRLLLDYNPFAEVQALDCRVTEGSGQQHLAGHDVIIQCVDNYTGRVAVHRAGSALGIPVVSMTGQPPYRAHVSTFFAAGPQYEEVFGLPSLGRPLDEVTGKSLDSLKVERAKRANRNGATEGWCYRFAYRCKGWGEDPVGWGITPERAYITATIQAHEALRIATQRDVLAAAPRAVIIDLSNTPNIVQVREPTDGKHWDYREF